MSQPEEFVVMHEDPIRRVELAIADMRAGRMVILVDDEDRENEGDLIVAAEHCTADVINFMSTWGRGLICLSLTGSQVQRLGLSMMAAHNQTPYNTAFTVSIEAREGVTTGISAADRARTVQVAIRPDATSRDIVTPGHMFPLRARDGGVLERVGQTEGSVDLSRMSGLNPAAVICEIMKPDGTMARLPDLLEFGAQHNIHICAVADLIKHRMRTERLVRREAEGNLEIPGLGSWRTRLYRETTNNGLHQAIFLGDLSNEPTLARVQVAPPPWSVMSGPDSTFGSRPMAALKQIREEGSGVLVLMHLDGGNNGLIQRAFTREFGGEIAFTPPARAEALRDLGTGCQILLDLGLKDLRLLAGTSRAILGVDAYGLHIVERIHI